MNTFTFYLIINRVNNKGYVGLTTQPIELRIYQHYWYSVNNYNNVKGMLISRAIRKYGIENFEYIVLCTIKGTIEEASEAERRLIQVNKTITPNGYNVATGGITEHDFNAKTTRVINVKTKEIRTIKNIKKFCLDHNLSYWALLKGRVSGKTWQLLKYYCPRYCIYCKENRIKSTNKTGVCKHCQQTSGEARRLINAAK